MKAKSSESSEKLMTKKKTVFDHVKHIREVQKENYFKELSDSDKLSFDKFIIIRALSVDSELLDTVSFLSKHLDTIPKENFYKFCISVIPKSKRFYPWIKSQGIKYNEEMVNLVGKWFHRNRRESIEYINILVKTEDGIKNLISICQAFGKTDKEIDKYFE